MYNTVPEEQPFVTAWMAKTGHEVVTLSEPLTVDNAGQAAGFDAVSTQQTTAMPAPVYRILAENKLPCAKLAMMFLMCPRPLVKKSDFLMLRPIHHGQLPNIP